ncbi:hypothetical protein B0H12DRAFT_1099607 [Mycena haematopus]|nr:hypothetical protein B0H12DRAFT_1099607 [Mycena haematopus]
MLGGQTRDETLAITNFDRPATASHNLRLSLSLGFFSPSTQVVYASVPDLSWVKGGEKRQ